MKALGKAVGTVAMVVCLSSTLSAQWPPYRERLNSSAIVPGKRLSERRLSLGRTTLTRKRRCLAGIVRNH
jgi:hypothetical protein